ncbi:MAG: hypothetical protein E7I11_30375, partial [Klebsiella michiganensis]|nr:hypothetical protein [Klebsiella michiganensis]
GCGSSMSVKKGILLPSVAARVMAIAFIHSPVLNKVHRLTVLRIDRGRRGKNGPTAITVILKK